MTMTKTEMWAEHNRIEAISKEIIKELKTEVTELRHFVEWISDGGPKMGARGEAQQARDLLDGLYGKDAVDQAAGARARV